MNQIIVTSFLSMLLALSVASCGKKAQEPKSENPINVSNPVDSNLEVETHKELQKAIIENDLAKLEDLLTRKNLVDLSKRLENGETLLTLAASHNRFRMTQILNENGASPYKTNIKSETPLIVAAKFGYENLIKLLVSIGSKPNSKDTAGNTALHVAILNKFEEVALYLINNGTNFDITNNNDETPIKLAELRNLQKVIDLLRSLTQTSIGLPDKAAVKNIVTLGDVESLDNLIKKYPGLLNEYKDLDYLGLVIESHPHDKALNMTNLLVQAGVGLNGPTDSSQSPLIAAVKADYQDFVDFFLRENANPNLLDASGKSALIWSIIKNKPSLLKSLKDRNAPEKYTYDENGRKKTMRACTVAREMRTQQNSTEDKKANEEIQELLGCGLRWLI